MQRYVSAALDVLAGDACGWILDLRGDSGGNVFAMLVALGPLLGPGPALSYQHRDGSVDFYDITPVGDLAAQDGTVLAEAPTTVERFSSDLPIAVLHGSSTASAGEGIVMATRGRHNVRSFGQPTAGLPTGNTLFEFSDGSAVNLTVAIGIDAAGEPHEGPIPPDVTTDNADADAVAWLLAQPNCQPPQ
ncbi:MAG: S41 family peptidase [Acidimicrobiia bacterium]|nr:S41 family peptidase [Acidimicrobiia bacterium]